jgi:radical SAM family uncharacterized protein/radical SAM-linked protein
LNSAHSQFSTQAACIQEILDKVEKPSRYLGTEVNRVVKNPGDVSLHMALAFPDLYEIGTSHFGIQILYHLLNRRSDTFAERVFAPATDLNEQLRRHDLPLCSLESRTPLDRFHIIGFSLLYELNFTNVLNMLDLAKLPLRSEHRTEDHPLIIAGGPCVSNPEPMAPFFDAMVFGDGEQVIDQMVDIWLAWKANGASKSDLLLRWSKVQGVYIPSLFEVGYDDAGIQTLAPLLPDYTLVGRAIVADLDAAFFPDRPILPFGRPIHDRLRLEISRGCSRGCRFCQAGMIYRPVRERSPDKLLAIADAALAATGYEDLSLLSLSTGDYTCLAPLMENLMRRCHKDRVAVSLPSVRADALTPALMALIKKVRKTGFTIAPEAGTQRLRDAINKNIRHEDVSATIQDAFALGWQVIKLYFMIGLPTETDADVDGIVEMVEALRKIKGPVKRRGQMNVSVTTFIPKAHTPFQWAPQISMEQSNRKLERLKAKLRVPGISVKWQNPAMSLLEGVIARGDRRVADVIERAWRLGCLFDGWSDQFNMALWQQAMSECGLDPDFFTTRSRSLNEPLPWDHMDSRVARSFLEAQWNAAHQPETLNDCRRGDCHGCGVCDFETIQPNIFEQCAEVMVPQKALFSSETATQIELIFAKEAPARLFGHLEVAGIFARALRRAQIEILYSQGFHPMPRMSFDDPLPLGMESEEERMWIKVSAGTSCQMLVERLEKQLPPGLRIVGCRPHAKTKAKAKSALDRYRVFVEHTAKGAESLARFHNQEQWPFVRDNRKGRRHETDLKNCVRILQWTDVNTLYLEIYRNECFTIRPADILRDVLQKPEDTISFVRVLKLAAHTSTSIDLDGNRIVETTTVVAGKQ